MLSKKISIYILSYLILTGNSIAANHHPIKSKIEQGKKIYHDHCKVCHGGKGDGKTFAANVLFPPPKNFLDNTTHAKLTRETMIRSITKGRPTTAMMPWEKVLSEQEILSVVTYIRKELMKLEK